MDNLPDFPPISIARDIVSITKGYRKHVSGFSERIKGLLFDGYSYNWAAKYCVFHDNLELLVQLGFHLLLGIQLDKTHCIYTNVALEIASFILCNNRIPVVLPKELVRLIVRSNFEEARCALKALHGL